MSTTSTVDGKYRWVFSADVVLQLRWRIKPKSSSFCRCPLAALGTYNTVKYDFQQKSISQMLTYLSRRVSFSASCQFPALLECNTVSNTLSRCLLEALLMYNTVEYPFQQKSFSSNIELSYRVVSLSAYYVLYKLSKRTIPLSITFSGSPLAAMLTYLHGRVSLAADLL